MIVALGALVLDCIGLDLPLLRPAGRVVKSLSLGFPAYPLIEAIWFVTSVYALVQLRRVLRTFDRSRQLAFTSSFAATAVIRVLILASGWFFHLHAYSQLGWVRVLERVNVFVSLPALAVAELILAIALTSIAGGIRQCDRH
jgi:dolichyl-phosphate-mannose--protein O-mannosyl transferase